MSEEIKLNIYQKLNLVRDKVKYIQKDKKIQGYKGITHDMVTAKLRDVFVENGIFVLPNQISGEVTDSGNRTSGGNTIILYKATYEVSFINMDDPNDKFTLQISSHANDTGDKAPGKAISYAIKTILLKVCMLESGDDEESRVEGERKAQEKITEEQAEWIADRVVEYNIDQVAFDKFLKSNRVKSIKDINVGFFTDIEKMINHKKPKGEDNA